MRRSLLIAGGLAALALLGAWALGGAEALAGWAAAGQRRFQEAMAGALIRLRAGEPGAWGVLMGLAFAYGFFHAVGPGHGKVLIGGYGAARPVGLGRLSAIALAASLAQGASAVALVYAGVLALGWTRQRMTGLAEGVLTQASYAAIGLIGLWLVWRGMRHLAAAGHSVDVLQAACCGHDHAPSPETLARAGGPREAALLVAGVALRPCTGALFLLVMTWQLGIAEAGIAGTFAMALGTASVTLAVAALAVTGREGALAGLAGRRAARLALPVLELSAGGVVVLAAATLLLR
ncbi:MAG: hypothetical protein CVT80_10930 [Alphaproteobacteria bacterium HGW-Alphaproteobacteria-2]|nr:MAG: hypothetical protein CVT80_10930 [Alphaproteobacteria bacterium HGW-Alphaproteobacteria-2]